MFNFFLKSVIYRTEIVPNFEQNAQLKIMQNGKKEIGKFGLTTNIELLHMADKLGFPLDVLSKNEFRGWKDKREGNYIINLQDSDKGMGTHWVGLIVYKKEAYYFDSFGLLPPLDVIYFVNPYKKNTRDMYISNKQIQNIYGAYCGQYTISFIRFMKKTNKQLSNKQRFDKFISMWKDREV